MLLFLPLLLMNGPWIESKEFSRSTQERVLNATLRLTTENPKGEGTAIRIGRQGPFVYYLTVNHNVERVDVADLESYAADSFPTVRARIEKAKVLARNPGTDLAILRAYEANPPGFLAALESRPQKAPFAVLSSGCSLGKNPELLIDEVIRSIVAKTPQNVRAHVWETKKTPDPGRSGGPLVDVNGCLVGICSGNNDGKGYYIQIQEVREFLKLQGLERLDYSLESSKSKK